MFGQNVPTQSNDQFKIILEIEILFGSMLLFYVRVYLLNEKLLFKIFGYKLDLNKKKKTNKLQKKSPVH